MQEDIRDRGTKKWTAIMLPEHIKEIKNWMNEDHYEERPKLDDYEYDAIQESIDVAYKRKSQILIKTWQNGKINQRGGVILDVDIESNTLSLDNPFGIERIAISDIIWASMTD